MSGTKVLHFFLFLAEQFLLHNLFFQRSFFTMIYQICMILMIVFRLNFFDYLQTNPRGRFFSHSHNDKILTLRKSVVLRNWSWNRFYCISSKQIHPKVRLTLSPSEWKSSLSWKECGFPPFEAVHIQASLYANMAIGRWWDLISSERIY